MNGAEWDSDNRGGDINSFPSELRRRQMPARRANPAVIAPSREARVPVWYPLAAER